MAVPEIAAACWFPPTREIPDALYRPWVVVGALVRVTDPSLGATEDVWLNWVVPVEASGPDPERAYRHDPGRRAGRPGEPPDDRRATQLRLDPGLADVLWHTVWASAQLELHCCPPLGLTSRVDEPLADFRRRCMGIIGPAARAAAARRTGDPAAIPGALAAVETISLTPGEVRVLVGRVRAAWYPAGEAPLKLSGGGRATKQEPAAPAGS
jgi:hypothetical protein